MFRHITGRIVEKFGTQKEFAKALGESEASVSLRLSGKVGFTREDIEKWADMLGLAVESFFYKDGSQIENCKEEIK